MGKKLKNELNVMLNSISLNEDDPTLLNCKFTILDFEKSRNNVVVERDEALELGRTIKGKPIRALYKENALRGEGDFGDHEAELSLDRNGKEYIKRNTIPIGVFTSDGYIETINVEGKPQEVLVADAHLWYSQFKEPIQLLTEWFEQGLEIQMSCEYLYYNYEMKDGVEYHRSPLLMESHVVLGSQVTPAYSSARLLQFNQVEQFNLAVAQALNQKENKEVSDLAEEVKVTEELETTVEQVEETTETIEVVEDVQTNEIQEEKVETTEAKEETTEEVVEKAEEVDTEKTAEEIAQLNAKIEELTQAKAELVEKFNSATETITQLNQQVEELKPFKEQFEKAQKESMLNEAMEKFEAKFNSIGAESVFKEEEVQNLIAQSIEVGEVGLNAKLALNEKIVELATKKLEVNANPLQTIMNSVSKRDFKELVTDNGNDPLSEYRF